MAQSSASPRPDYCSLITLRPAPRLRPPCIIPLNEDDIITAIEFEKRGDYLALGDRGGRVLILHKRNDRQNEDSAPSRFYEVWSQFEFQSHQNDEFPGCTNRIKKVRWCNTQNGLPHILSANDMAIKLWKIAREDNIILASGQNIYVHGNNYSRGVHSISNNSDGERFISADDFQIISWNLEDMAQIRRIIEIKDMSEMITSAECHPSERYFLAYGSSRGYINLYDLRQSSTSSRFFDGPSPYELFLEEPDKCISDIKFFDDGLGGQHLLCRDLEFMKLWDLRMNSKPVTKFPAHNQLQPRSSDIYDRFDCCVSGGGDRLHFVTGSYGNLLRIFRKNGAVTDLKGDDILERNGYRWPTSSSTRGLFHVSGHPTSNLVACGIQNFLMWYRTGV